MTSDNDHSTADPTSATRNGRRGYAGSEGTFRESLKSEEPGPAARFCRAIGRRWDVALIVTLAVLLWLPRLSGPIDLRTDAAAYYVLGTSLAEGHGYRVLSEPGAPEAVQYPPLLPAFVALHERALGTTNPAVVAPWLRISYAALFLGYAVSVIALARRFLRPGFAVIASGLALLQVMTIFLSDLLFAEIPFALVSAGFLLLAATPQPTSRLSLREAGLFVLATAGFLLRTAGVALLAAWVFEALVRRRYRLTLARAVLALLPIVAWQAYVGRVTRSNDYLHPAYEYQRAPYQNCNVTYTKTLFFKDSFRPELGKIGAGGLAARFATNAVRIVPAIGEMVSTTESYWARLIANAQKHLLGRRVVPQRREALPPLIGLAGLVAVGLGVLGRGRAWTMILLILGSVALICTTPWPDQFTRYLVPLTPVLTICAILGMLEIYSRLRRVVPRRASVLVKAAFAGILLIGFAAQTYAARQIFQGRQTAGAVVIDPLGSRSNSRLFYHDQFRQAWEEAVAWIAQHSDPEAIIATSSPQLCYLRSGRRAVLPPMEADATRARRLLEAVPVTYVIVDQLEFVEISRRYALPAVESDPLGWCLVHTVGGTRIFAHPVAH